MLRLSCVNRLGMPFESKLQRSVLLDLAWMQGNIHDEKTLIFQDLNGIKLGGVELARDRVQRTRDSAMRRVFRRRPKASSGARTRHPYGVPASVANHRIENRRRDLFYQHPAAAEGHPDRIQTIGQNAPLTQENRMPLHDCALLGISGACGSVESVELALGADGIPVNVCSRE